MAEAMLVAKANKVPGVKPPPIQALVRAQDRLTFLYAEHCVVNRADNAVTITDARGTVHVPAAALGVLMLGPGSNITYAAISLLAESRSTCVWVGERGVRYYCHGASLAQSTRLLEAQAKFVSSERSRVKVARNMYAMRFPDENTDGLTMQQLLGKEGTRIRRAYAKESKRTGVQWSGRSYKVTDFDDADEVNKALSAANTALYGVTHSIIVALGCSPGLGFVHAHNERSFVYDIADLYKADITIPLAFDLVSQGIEDVSVAARKGIRDRMKDGKFMQRCVRDIRRLLLEPEELKESELEVEDITTKLWSGASGYFESGRNYAFSAQNDDVDGSGEAPDEFANEFDDADGADSYEESITDELASLDAEEDKENENLQEQEDKP
jgi:CRISPR-associated protein Cas1